MRNLANLCVAVGAVAPLVAVTLFFTRESFDVGADGAPHFVDRTPELVAVFVTPVISAVLFVIAGRLSPRH